jgi:hypothetical protein
MTKPKEKTKPDGKMKTYLLNLVKGGQRKITIPAAWKITFGPLLPGSRGQYNGERGICLRVYETKERQRAVFTDVESFRDMEVVCEEKITKTDRQTVKRKYPEGDKWVEVEARVEEWRNPDEIHKPGKEFLKLNSIIQEDED